MSQVYSQTIDEENVSMGIASSHGLGESKNNCSIERG